MTTKILRELTAYFLKEYFDGIPEIPVSFASNMDLDGAAGVFCMRPGEEYDVDNDELIDCPSYKVRHVSLVNNTGYWVVNEESWRDPLNHPDICIRINRKYQKHFEYIAGTLLHELMHYYCWYMGYDYRDRDYEFNRRCIDRGIPTNFYDYEFTGECWRDTFDYSTIRKYTEGFIDKVGSAPVGVA